ncbi:MAG: DUF721 domain-containing protein [Armatimonadetes bacterium]|nr:DUF721 domain-containing protein [Armatimonadota bacterium]
MRKADLHLLSDLLPEAIARPEVIRRLHAQVTSRRWEEFVGKQLACKSSPERFENGTLWVAVSGASWVQELTMRKREILDRLNELAGTALFKDVRFGNRPIKRTLHESSEPASAEAEPLHLEVSTPELEIAKQSLGKLKAMSKRKKR